MKKKNTAMTEVNTIKQGGRAFTLCTVFIYMLLIGGCAMSGGGSDAETVAIGDQVWTTKNLNTPVFRNGDKIYHATTPEEWKQAAEEKRPAWCYMNHDSTLQGKFGKLYNWYAISDPRGLAPEGWHIPTDDEWEELINHLGKDAGHKMKASRNDIRSGTGNNRSGFTGMFGGYCMFNGQFTNRHVSGVWWSTTETDDEEERAWAIQLSSNKRKALRMKTYKVFGASVRCVKD